MDDRRHRLASPGPRALALLPTLCLLVAGAAWAAPGPQLQPTHAQAGSASASGGCSNVSWLNPPQTPKFLVDVPQAAGSGECQFHEFASQNFLALVLGDSPAIVNWPSSDQVYPASGAPNCGGGAPLGSALRHRLMKSPTDLALARARGQGKSLDDILQATGDPLVDQDGRYVQFEIRTDPQFCQAVSSCQLYTKTCVQAAMAANPDFRFPSGNVQTNTPGVAEVKIAWRVMETCNLPDSPSPCTPTNLGELFTVPNVTVNPYSPKNAGPVTVTIGMVGFHLIQKTPTHPEYIWGTWEHVSNDPVCAGSDNSACQDPSATSQVGTASGWSLANPPASTSSACSGSNPPANCANVSYYNPPSGSEVDPNQPDTQVCRLFPCGGGDQENLTDVASLNQAIRNRLTPQSVWWNYFLVGTLWGSGNTSGGSDPSQPNAGSVDLANTTMETFFQASGQNCFTCHNDDPDPEFTNLDFTHSLVRAQQQGSACTVNFSTCTTSPAAAWLIRSSSAKR